MDDLEEQLKVLRLQLEQSRAQTTEAQQKKAAVESEWQAQKLHLEQELARSHQSSNWEPAAATPQSIYMYVQRERRMPKLGGRPQKPEDPDVDDWTSDTENHLQANPFSDREGLDFVMDHLNGPAGQEVRFREPRTAMEALQIVRRLR